MKAIAKPNSDAKRGRLRQHSLGQSGVEGLPMWWVRYLLPVVETRPFKKK
ncbi:hypothetical protein Hanom_Chr16g01517971 [Helianthus anomalus]